MDMDRALGAEPPLRLSQNLKNLDQLRSGCSYFLILKRSDVASHLHAAMQQSVEKMAIRCLGFRPLEPVEEVHRTPQHVLEDS